MKKSIMTLGIITLVFFILIGVASAATSTDTTSATTTKEQVGSAGEGIAAITNVPVPIKVPGKWTLYYDWTGSGKSYTSTEITFNSISSSTGWGTFTIQGSTGKWTQCSNNGMIIFKFDNYNTAYSGNVAGKTMTGIMSTFGGSSLNGCWYAIKK